jgi:sec-independent protein translocase protein TatA
MVKLAKGERRHARTAVFVRYRWPNGPVFDASGSSPIIPLVEDTLRAPPRVAASEPVAGRCVTTTQPRTPMSNVCAFISMPGGWEWAVILVVGVLIFGRRLPEIARSLGKSVVEFKKGLADVKGELDVSARPADPHSLPPAQPRAESDAASSAPAPPTSRQG